MPTPTLRRYWIRNGLPGTSDTLAAMAGLARRAARHPLTVAQARAIVSAAPRDGGGQVTALAAWLREHWSFVPDPVGFGVSGSLEPIELLRDPVFTLQRIRATSTGVGDCDDVAMLAAALGMARHLPARFRVVGFDATPFYSHVYAELQEAGAWRPLDVTRVVNPMDPFPARPTHSAVYDV